jgi:hypothetical protein
MTNRFDAAERSQLLTLESMDLSVEQKMENVSHWAQVKFQEMQGTSV